MRDRKRILLLPNHCQRDGTKNTKKNQLLQRFEKCGDTKECSQRIRYSRIYVGSSERRWSCMDLFFTAMFYLCTFSFRNLNAADTEVHLMRKCRYFYLCLRACCALHPVCSLYCPMWTNMNRPLDQGQDTIFLRWPKDVWHRKKVKGCLSVSSSVSVCFVTMLSSVITSNAAVHPPG